MTPSFASRAREGLGDDLLRTNLRRATDTIGSRRASAVDDASDWEALREAGRMIKAEALGNLSHYLLEFETAATQAGATVHWARTGAEAAQIVTGICKGHRATKAIKAKSLTTDEIHLNERLAQQGITAIETDLAELILQLDDDWSSHIVVPALHRNRSEIRDIFQRTIAPDLQSNAPETLAAAARLYLREHFLVTDVGISGANFAVAETGSLCLVESEGNGRMCTTLPRVLISIVGIEKVIPRFRDLGVFLQLLPRSATGERMNPYTSIWTGVASQDGPQELHVVLLDAGRTTALEDPVGRDALSCIRCGACLNICPVYTRAGGHAYDSVYAGPIGAILAPQIDDPARHSSLPYASTLCGACYEVCPVKIDIPRILVHLRDKSHHPMAERGLMGFGHWVFRDHRRVKLVRLIARRLAPFAWLPAWTRSRDLPELPRDSFSDWWRER